LPLRFANSTDTVQFVQNSAMRHVARVFLDKPSERTSSTRDRQSVGLSRSDHELPIGAPTIDYPFHGSPTASVETNNVVIEQTLNIGPRQASLSGNPRMIYSAVLQLRDPGRRLDKSRTGELTKTSRGHSAWQEH
jgi:hypothetical protein